MDAFKRINVTQAQQLCAEGAVMVDIRDPEALLTDIHAAPFIWITSH